jgi:sec-independent protein translocase protein TatA
MISMPGMTEWVIILIICLVIFGGGKLAGVGKSLGTAISEFKSAIKNPDEEKKDTPAADKKE